MPIPTARPRATRRTHAQPCLRLPARPTVFLAGFILVMLAAFSKAGTAPDGALPTLGDSSSGIISIETERRLGAGWLRELRARTKLFYDPFVNDYVEHLAYRIAAHSDLVEPRLSLVVMNDAGINAFAVPGGVLGVNAGLLLHAGSEDEFAGVVAHELAHLSQRHYARSLEQQKRAQPLALSALLAAILVASTVGGDAGAAAIVGTQAGLAQSQLAHSREHEREADRVGMQALARAGFDPQAMPGFFERLQRSMPQDEGEVPEYVMTHPVTESRISDSRNRARLLPSRGDRADSLEFLLARARVQVAFARDARQAVKDYTGLLESTPAAQQAPVRFALAVAQLRAQAHDDALATLAPLRKAEPERIAWRLLQAEILLDARRPAEAVELLVDGLAVAPDNFPLSMTAAQALLQTGQSRRAVALLERQALLRRDDPNVWALLARARGDAGDPVGVHAARAEYLFLLGQTDPAREQLTLGIEKAGDRFSVAAPLRNRLHEFDEMRDDFRP